MFFASNRGPTIEKDPVIQQLRQDVANRMWEILEPVAVPDEQSVNFVSFEEALKELVELKKSS